MPNPIVFDDAEMQGNEVFKSFPDTDSLGKAYMDLDSKVKGGSLELLPEEMRKDPALSVFKTLPDLARGYVETKKMVGGFEKAPEKPDGYKFSPMANLHGNVKPEVIQPQLAGILHKGGVGNKAADVINQGVLTLLSNNIIQQEKTRTELAQKNETELRAEWGQEYDARFDKIVKVMTGVMGKDAAADTDQISKALKGSPNFLKGMGKLVSLLSEDAIGSLGEGQERPVTDAKGAQEAIQKYNAEIIAGGSKHAYSDEKNPEHGAARKKMDELFQKAYPQG